MSDPNPPPTIKPVTPPSPSVTQPPPQSAAAARARSGSTASEMRSRSNSVTTNRSRGNSLSQGSAPAPNNTVVSPRLPAIAAASQSQTHAGGILPPASFFRPTRPPSSKSSQALPFGPTRAPSLNVHRPASLVSTGSSTAPMRRLAPLEPIGMANLSKQVSHESEGSTSADAATTYTLDENGSHGRNPPPTNAAKPKPSREALLPIGERSSIETSGINRTTPPIGMRQSLERMFRRTLSVDSVKGIDGRSGSAGGRGSPRSLKFSQDLPRTSLPALLQEPQSASAQDPTSAISKASLDRPPSRHPHFAPSPPPPPQPPTYPPASSVPIVSKSTGRQVRNYHFHPSRNTFCFGGRLLTGGDSPLPFIGALILVFGIAGIWFGTIAPWWWKHESPAVAAVGAYMTILTIMSMLITAFKDPGIIPRNLDPEPPYPSSSPSDGAPRAPLPRDLRVRAGVVRVKYCVTCKTYRPPRSSHCKTCDNCVDGCDHHCQWVNNCVGRRNYTNFMIFLISAILTLILVVVTAALQLYFISHRGHLSFKDALGQSPGSAVVFCLAISSIWPVATLLAYHARLLFLNITTIEQIRNHALSQLAPGPAPPNPFALGRWYRNVAVLFCRPAGFSWINPSGYAMEDKRHPNPGARSDESEMEEGRMWGTAE